MKAKIMMCLALAGPMMIQADAAPARVAPTYTARADGYALWLPGRPQQAVKKASIPGLGRVNIRFITLAPSPVAYVVTPTPVPAGYSASNARTMLDGIQRGFLLASKGRLISSKSITLGRYPGRELVMTMGQQAPGVHMRGRFFITPRRSYQVMALARPAQLAAKKAQVDKVLGSFQILNP